MKMRNFPFCFTEKGVQVADASCSSIALSKPFRKSVNCLYKSEFLGELWLIAVVWSKNLMGQCVSIAINNASCQCICGVDVKPSLFSRRKGSKSLVFNSSKIQVFWDLSRVESGPSPEPLKGYYIAIVFKGEMILVIGDMRKEAFKKTGVVSAPVSNAMLISKRKHISGKMLYETNVEFCNNGPIHDMKIECNDRCNDDPSLVVWIDGEMVMQVEHLKWKFRGNWTILVDGMPVEVYWDMREWLFGSGLGHAIFLFRTRLSLEKKLIGTSSSFSDSNLLSWSCIESVKDDESADVGFSLVLYTWKNE